MKMSLAFRFAMVLGFFISVDAAPASDLITHLPGMASLPSFKQYSGYLDASGTKHFHYWFVESQKDPEKDPVVLWLNGGPGCSSLDGLLSEHGPIHVRDDGKTLYMNPYSWNLLANVIYIESPAGVGYSYDDTGKVKTDDYEVAKNNYAALQSFFKKFPEYANNPFYVTGESYGGVYIPSLALLVAQGNEFNFKGLAVGNGLSSYKLNDKSLVFFAYYHGLFGEVLWNNLHGACCKGGFSKDNCTFHEPSNTACSDYVSEVFRLVYQSGLNEYALYMDCDDNGHREKAYRFAMDNLFRNLHPMIRKKVALQKIQRRVGSERLGASVTCINSTAVENWLNDPEVRSAIHIPSSVQKWELCSDAVSGSYGRKYMDMTETYKKLLAFPDLRVLIYNGDTDMACNFLGDQWFVASLDLPEVSPHAPWYINMQVAGFAREFKQLTFTTIRGAGHMVPQWAPAYALEMFRKFLAGTPFQGSHANIK